VSTAGAFHGAALRRCIEADGVAILHITRAESLIHPTRAGKLAEADAALDALGFRTRTLDDAIADCARDLLATHGSRNFPMADAVVVAAGIERGWAVITCDSKWPTIADVTIEVLEPDAAR
jgi:predicted nucleic acid-binding protein